VALKLLLFLACALGCQVKEDTPDYAQLAEDLTFHRQLWENQHVASYVARFQQTCSCPAVITQPVRMEVEGSTVTSVADTATGTPIDTTLWVYFPTVSQLFDIIDVEIRYQPHRLEVAFHAELGYPTSVVIDPSGSTGGDDISYALEIESYTIMTAIRSAAGREGTEPPHA
jgi:hypothetical protein